MEESGTKLHIPLVLKHFVLFPQKLSVCGRVCIIFVDFYEVNLFQDETTGNLDGEQAFRLYISVY